jgi:hypothetical protein
MYLGEDVRNSWFIFIQDSNSEKGVRFFRIETLKAVWTSSYAVIDFSFLSNHEELVTDTLILSISRFPHDSNGSWLDVKQFHWQNSNQMFVDNICFTIEDNLNIVIWARQIGQYMGFSFNVRTLESRSTEKPKIEIINQYVVRETVILPIDIKKGW